MTRLSPTRTAVAMTAAVAVAVLVTGFAAGSDRAAPAAVRPVPAVPVTDSVLVCPVLLPADSLTTSVVSASSPGTSGTISMLSMAASAAAAPLAELQPGQSVLRYAGRAGAKPVPVLVHATGARARGLTAQVVTRVSGGTRRSAQVAPCSAPTGDVWLVGGSTASGRRDVVYLTNADGGPAVADVTVYGPDGELEPSDSQGVTVPARGQVQLQLDELAPGLASTAVQVHVRSGRLAAALQDAAAVGSVPGGVDWVPPSTPPARSLVVTGIPGDTGARHVLSLLVPGQDQTTVRVRFATADGLLSPGQVNAITVPAGRLLTVDLGKAGVAEPYTLLIDADQPVLAGVLTTEGSRGRLPDIAWAGGSPRVLGGAVVAPWVYRTGSVSTAVQVTAAGGADVVVRLTTYSAIGVVLGSQDYTVQAGRQLQVAPGSVALGSASVLVEAPLGADVVVGMYTIEYGAHGPLVGGGPLLQTALTVPRPPAAADPAVGFPGH